MRMTVEEFHRIRPLQWTIREFGNKTYNTTYDETETRLFWLDFIRNVWAPKFAAQSAITRVANFDVTQPVLLTNDLDLKLPDVMATIAYYADNQNAPKSFALPVSHVVVLISGLFALFCLLLVSIFIPSFDTKSHKSTITSSTPSSSPALMKIGRTLHAKFV